MDNPRTIGAFVVIILAISAFLIFGDKSGEGPVAEVPAQDSPQTESPDAATPIEPASRPAAGGASPSPTQSPNKISPAPAPKPTPAPISASGKKAKDLVSPSYYINTGRDAITIAGYRGKKVVLVEFWTYSNINSRRTVPYLNGWYTKYREKGLEIVAIHTPEFDFEKDQTAVENTVRTYGMSYPVVLDTSGATSRAWGNKNWPHTYLIDIDGNIAYDHVGEGGYEAIEAVMQDLLAKRATKLGLNVNPRIQIAPPWDAYPVTLSAIKTPELYCGANANTRLQIGTTKTLGQQTLQLPASLLPDTFALGGTWNFLGQYAESKTEKAAFAFPYEAKRIYALFGAPKLMKVKVTLDGQPLGGAAGKDVTTDNYGNSYLMISTPRIYEVVSDPEGYSKRKIEFTAETPGLQCYVVRFG